ncbi:glycosyltransferase [Acinetobacter junii]|uniref:Glycosyltransferase n=1 Tax=Acinetobacter junii TaxID=40215 RepID=A0ABU8ZD44_ACIJU|nr:glycosyltransferase [Acinetobacter junii]MCE6004000.1 glycosyltransferase [Acinetobacter junii]MDH1856844.1 glycosyltransferase [Acinetobacter junii]
MIKLSVIIPIYKVEKYIIECLESVCCQLVDGVEVILVNDGTPDNAMLMAHQYISEQYTHLKGQFVFIDQKNQGQSVARNVALKKAVGEYIAFVDSDDVLTKEYFKQLLPLLGGIDIIQFKSARFLDDISELASFNVGIEKKQGRYEASRELMVNIFNQSAWFPWLNVYKKTLFDGLYFPEDVYFEDAVLIPAVFLRAKDIYFLDIIMYLYRINNEGSLLRSSKDNISKLVFSYNKALDIHIGNVELNNIYSPVVISLFRNYIDFVFKQNGVIQAIKEYYHFRNKIYPYIEKSRLGRGNLFFYKYGFVFFLFHKVFINLRDKIKEIVK